MKTLANLTPAPGSARGRKRLGRGIGSGWGKTAGKGHKGQKARKGGGPRPGFEGGQTPLYKRTPKFGFSNNQFAEKIYCVRVDQLNCFAEGEKVTTESLLKAGLIKNLTKKVKIIGNCRLDKKLNLEVNKITAGARELILKNGGTVKEI
jgi:large subunit ribosomal protein L15